MQSLWNWLAKNHKQLTGLAAVLAVLALAKPLINWFFFSPELIVRVDIVYDSTPHDLLEWVNNVGLQLRALTEREHDTNLQSARYSSVLEKLREYGRSEILDKAKLSSDYAGVGKVVIDIDNRSDKDIVHPRVSIDSLWGCWSVFIDGTFLTQQEKERFRSGVRPERDRLVLPELPTIPPHGSIQLVVFGGTGWGTAVRVSAANARTAVTQMITVKESWWLRWYRLPGGSIALGALLCAYTMLVLLVGGAIAASGRTPTPGEPNQEGPPAG